MFNPVNLWRLQKQNKNLLGLKGKILCFTTIHAGPIGFTNQIPYALAIAILENGQKITTQVINPEKITIGSHCEVIIRRLKTPLPDEVIDYGPKLKIIT